MTRADKRFLLGFRALVGREPNAAEWRFWRDCPAADTPEGKRANQEWTLRMHDMLRLREGKW